MMACTPSVPPIAACPTWCFLLKILKRRTLSISEDKHAITTIFSLQGRTQILCESKTSEEIDIRTYERGVEDETLACGTGSIASAVLSALLGKTIPPVAVRTASGFVLTIHFDLDGSEPKNVHLEGDARVIYAGKLEEGAWNY